MADLLWERQARESEQAYQAFRAYLDQGEGNRSLETLHHTLTKSTRLLKEWSRRWNWGERSKAYDAAMRAKEQAARERAQEAEAATWAARRAEEAEQEWAASRQLLDKARVMLQFPLVEQTTENGKTVVKPARWALRDAATLLDTAAKLARLAAGMETGRQTLQGPDGAPLLPAVREVVIMLPEERRESVER